MNIRASLSVVTLALLASGCATHVQAPVAFKSEVIQGAPVRVGVGMSRLPKVNTFFPGADCLLCMATAELTNASLTSHTKTLGTEDLPSLKEQAAEILRKKGVNVVVIEENIDLDSLPSSGDKVQNVAVKSFASLAQKYQVDKVVVFSVDMIGFSRNYSAYIPSADPKAVFKGVGYMVDGKSNAYDWYAVADVAKAADGSWDEGPTFPGLTNAYFQSLELGKDIFLKPLAQ